MKPTLGKVLLDWRNAQDPVVTQQALADELGVTRQFISLIETRDVPVSFRLKVALARRMGIALDPWLTDDERSTLSAAQELQPIGAVG